MKIIPSWASLAAPLVFLAFTGPAAADFPLIQTLDAEQGSPGDTFGAAVAISGDQILVGAPEFDLGDNDGGAFVFEIGKLDQTQLVTEANPMSDHQFGSDVGLSEDYAVIIDHDQSGVHVYDARTWEALYTGDSYTGNVVAVHGRRAVVGSEDQVLLVDLVTDDIIRDLDDGGSRAVAIDHQFVVASYGDSIVIYDDVGQFLRRIDQPESDPSDGFGSSLAIHNGLLLVGSAHDTDHNGMAYLFDIASGEEIRHHEWPGTDQGKWSFGASVAIGDDYYMVGSPYGVLDDGTQGCVFVYPQSGSGEPTIIRSPGVGGEQFGDALDAEANVLIVGSPGYDRPDGGPFGRVYVYDLSNELDPEEESQLVFEEGAVWKYWDNDSRPEGWNQSGEVFDDAAWASGEGQLGYGDGDETTVVQDGQFLRATTYFRKGFEVSENLAGEGADLWLRLTLDDGAVIYLNGQEIARSNMPEGEIGHEALAASSVAADGEPPVVIEIEGALLAGDNVIAVEVHNSNLFSGDISFDMAFAYTVSVAPPYPGQGTLARPYLISTAEELAAIADYPQHWDSCFRLLADIDLAEHGSFRPIGISGNGPGDGFGGCFDGQGHTISNLQLDEEFLTNSQPRNLGLFSVLHGGRIKDLILLNPVVDAPRTDSVGTIVGRAEESSITRCQVIGAQVIGAETCGGIVGSEADGYFEFNHAVDVTIVVEHGGGGCLGGSTGRVYRCSSSGSVSGGDGTGGLIGGAFVGENRGPFGPYEVRESFSTCEVSGEDRIGGLIGWNTKKVRDCYARGSVSGDSKVGGLIGSKAPGYVVSCYSTGEARGAGGVLNGLIGDTEDENTGVLASFWDADNSGQSESTEGGTSKTTAQMLMVSTYSETGHWVDNYWLLRDGFYPRLRWEDLVGEAVYPGSGTPEDPFRISTAAQLRAIGDRPADWASLFLVVADIDCEGVDFNGIGDDEDTFLGEFDGGGHTISNYSNLGGVGLIARADRASIICNVTMTNAAVGGGAIVGVSFGSVRNCHVIDSVMRGGGGGGLANVALELIDCSAQNVDVEGLGGLVGTAGLVLRCWSSGRVEGEDLAGGLVGHLHLGQAVILQSFSRADVIATGGQSFAGGLLGHVDDYPQVIQNCYALGRVEATHAGGLIGHFYESAFDHSFAAGEVVGTKVGGLAGDTFDSWGPSEFNFWDVETSGTTDGGDENELFTGLTTAQMHDPQNFTDAGWDFVGETENGQQDIWRAVPGGYPQLWWEQTSSDEDGDGLLDAWEIEHFGQTAGVAPGDDPDGDRLNNTLEQALGLDPMSPLNDKEFLPSVSLGTVGDGGEQCLMFTFSLPEDIPEGVVYEVQVSAALGDWQALATRATDGSWSGDGEVSEHVASDGRLGITVCYKVTMADGDQRFMRLLIR